MPESSDGAPSLHDIAREALLEITSPESIGGPAGQVDEGDGVVSVQFESAMSGYPGWLWTVSISTLDGLEPSVLEAELMPADSALLAPDWVPWSERLAEYNAAQEAAAAEAGDGESDDESDGADDDDDDDDAEDDELGSDVVHAGDVDGVDIDDLDENALDDGEPVR